MFFFVLLFSDDWSSPKEISLTLASLQRLEDRASNRRAIYYDGSNESAGRKTEKFHLCAFSQCKSKKSRFARLTW